MPHDSQPLSTLSRTYAFAQPGDLGARARAMSGLEFLQELIAHDTDVPIGATLGFRLASVEPGACVFTIDRIEPHLFNPLGGVHGGWYAAVLDAPLGVALHSTLPAGVGYTTLELKVNLTRAAKVGQADLRAVGRLVHRGRTTAVTDAQILDAEQRVYAHATSTCLILQG
ncbi:MAG: PaaI family thioesterase [Polyangiales bacterium]|nr:PaaI family thioesterase [Myxococcales bacterium]MCB9657496.1 PaaI family thioesterase [Sandaracinaceae bacterium]